jgi:dienelactone hydrolase
MSTLDWRISRRYLGLSAVVLGAAMMSCASEDGGGSDESAADPGSTTPTSADGGLGPGTARDGGSGGASRDAGVGDPSTDGGSVDASPGSADGSTITSPAPTADSASKQGPCTVASYANDLPPDADYASPTVYYPTDCPGPWPGVVVVPGFTELQLSVNQWGTFLASHGFVVMCIDTAAAGILNPGVLPPSRASGLIEGVATLTKENERAGSPVAGNVDGSRMAVIGHSMGGGGALLAADGHPELKAAIGLCPWNPGISYPNTTVPTLVFAGTVDPLVPPLEAYPEYQSIPANTPKVYAEFNLAGHWVANTPLGGAPTDVVVARLGLSWLKVHVAGDARYQEFLATDPTLSTWEIKP